MENMKKNRKLRNLLVILISSIFLSCDFYQRTDIVNVELTQTQKNFNDFFSKADTLVLDEFYECQGDILKLYGFFSKYNLPKELLPPIIVQRTSCTNGMCGFNFLNKNLVTQFNLASNPWRTRWVQPLFDEIQSNNIPFSGPGIIIIFGNGSCPYANASAIASVNSNKQRYYLIGAHGLHSCAGVMTGPIPFFDMYSGMEITSQLSCLYPPEISQYSIALASLFQCIPLFSSIAEDGSNILPGGYWLRYGVTGFGNPDGSNDAEIEMSHGSVYGVK